VTGKFAAHHDVRQDLGCSLLFTEIWSLGSIFEALEGLPSLQGWAMLILGLSLIVVAVGIWRATEWARLAIGALASLFCLWSLGTLVHDFMSDRGIESLGELLGPSLMGLLAWGSFRSSTRKSFADARESSARARAVPG